MAKNLKLNVKNTQLAEALKLTKPQKTPSKKQTSDEEPLIAKAVSGDELPRQEEPKKAPPEPVLEKEPTPEPIKAAPATEEAAAIPEKRMLPGFKKQYPYSKQSGPSSSSQPREERPFRPSSAPREGAEQDSSQPRESRPYNSNQPPRESRPYNSNYTPREGSRPPYVPGQGASRPPYNPNQPPREGSRPYNPNYTPREGSRPYNPNYTPREGSRPPYVQGQGASRPPFVPGQGSSRPPYNPNQPPRDGSRPPYSPRPPFKREGFAGPDLKRSLPPIKEPGKEIPQQHQQYKKPTTQFSPDKDNKNQKKTGIGRSFDARDRQGLRDGDDEQWRKRKAFKSKQQLLDEVIRPKELKVRLPITVKDLAVEMKLKASQLIAKLFMQGLVLTLNDYLDDETTIQLLGHEFECSITIDTTEEERIRVTGKNVKEEIKETDPSELELRPPVVAFMGHVDHGKTSLIDAIRKSNIAASESGAITQHIGAFKCQTQVGLLTVLDTPGHEAFSSMRERGAEVTDIVVLVIAGDEGIKTQTIEAIKQAKEANVTLVVAINKSDRPGFDAEVVYRQLAEQNLLPEAWGGSVITVNCSALTGEGVKELLEMLALQAEVLELKANPASRARGSVIESEMHKGLGPVATILVQNGTLKLGDALVFGHLYARVKTMHDEHGKEVLEAGPSTPVKVTGLSGLPLAGSEFIVVKSEKEAKEISEKRSEGQKSMLLQQSKKASMESLLQTKAESTGKKTLNLILKADVQGSLEALKSSLRKLPSKKVEVNFVIEGIGEISESDIQYAAASKATILGFHTKVESHAETLIKQTKVDIRLHDIIYHAVDDIKAHMLSLLDKIPQENEMGEATVKAIFKSSQLGNIAGCQVSEGMIRRNFHARLVRNKEVIWKGPIASLKRNKEDVREVQKGLECGILLQGFTDFKEEDIIQVYEITYLQQELT